MRRKNATMICLMTCLLILTALTASIRASNGSHFKWVNPAYAGPDMFYSPIYPFVSIVGYLEGTRWNFSMSIKNDYPGPFNISAVRVEFEWGRNYTHRFSSPHRVLPGHTKIFHVSNMTPFIEDVPELWTYHYDVYIDRINDTSIEIYENDDFAILSEDHLECLRIFAKLGIFSFPTDGELPPFITDLPNVTETQVLLVRVSMRILQGMQHYQMGLFGQAESYLQDADVSLVEALSVWNMTGTAMEEAIIGRREAEGNYYNALADSSLVNAYGWLFFGLGWILIGLGVIIYGARKPKVV